MIDFHTHILPGLDDGAKTMEISMEMLSMEQLQGIEYVVCTPHFSAAKDLSEYFFKHRDDAIRSVIQTASEKGLKIPHLIPAAEVRLTRGLYKCEYLKSMTIGDTNYILIELPYDEWTNKWVPEELYAIKAQTNLKIVLAHAERYISNKKEFEIMEHNFRHTSVVQINAESFLLREGRKWIKKFIKKGCAIVVGSDCHSTGHRKPCMNEGLLMIEKKFGKECKEAFIENAKVILDL